MNRPTAHVAFDELLTADTLSALMRSTWTWDDRALRRDLAILLVDLDAVRAVAPGPNAAQAETLRRDLAILLVDLDAVRAVAPGPNAAQAETLRARAHSSAARFVAAVLGPKLIADTGNPLRTGFLADAIDPAQFDRAAATSFAGARSAAPEYVSEHTRDLDYPAETDWLGLAASDGAQGLGRAMRGYGNSSSASAFFGCIGLAWQTLRAVIGDSTIANEYAERLLAGSLSATLAAAEQTGSWDPAMVKTRAAETTDGWQLTGVKQFVPATENADVYLVIARSTAGPSLFAVESSAPGLSVTALDVIDPSRPLAQIDMSSTPATLLGTEGAGGRLMLRAIDLATTALAAEQVGIIEKVMNLLVDQSPDAPDFDTRLADVALDHVAAAALWRRALDEDAAKSPDASAAAAAAHIGCSAAAVRAATTAAELLGPSGETDAILRRALSGSLLFGGPALSHERLLERLGI